MTLSSSGAQDLREPPLHRPHVQTGTLRPESKLRVRPDPYIPLQSSLAPEAPSPGPQPPLHSLPSVAGTAHPCLPSAHSRKPPGRKRGSFLFGETPLFLAPLCQGALAKNWARKGSSASSLRWGKLPPHSSHLHMEGHPVVTGCPVVTSTFTGGFGTRPEVLSSRREGPPPLFPDQLFLRSCAFNCCCSPPTCKGLPLAGRGSSWTAES